MTREELLQHRIIIGDSLDLKQMKYFCSLGFKLLYYQYGRVPVLVCVGNFPFGRFVDDISIRYRIIPEENISKLQITFKNGLLYHYKWVNDIKDVTNIVIPHFYKYD